MNLGTIRQNQAKTLKKRHNEYLRNYKTNQSKNSVFSVHFVIGETIITVNVLFISSCVKMAYRHRTFV